MMSRITLEHGVLGGMEQHGHALANGLCALGHEVVVITTAPSSEPYQNSEALYRTIHIPDASAGQYSHTWWVKSARVFDRLDQDQPFDLVWSQQAGAYGWIRHFKRRYVPLVVIAQGLVIAALTSEAAHLRTWRALGRYVRQAPRRLWTLATIDRIYMRRADGFIVVTPYLAHVVRRAHMVRPERLKVILLSADTNLFAPSLELREKTRAALGIDRAAKVVLFVGRLERLKGMHVLLQAMVSSAALADVHAVIVGNGSERTALESQAEMLGMSQRVHFTGLIERDTIPAYYNAADVFVVPTLATGHFEGGPTVVAEAMACGVPVVASDLAAPRALVGDERCGRLVQPGDPIALGQAMVEILTTPGLCTQIGNAARARAVQTLSQDAMVRQTMAVFEDIARHHVHPKGHQ